MEIWRQLRDLASESVQFAQRKREERARLFLDPLQELVNDLTQKPLPVDWRERLNHFLTPWQSFGYKFETESVARLEAWIEAWARFRRLMPASGPTASATAEAGSFGRISTIVVNSGPFVSGSLKVPPLDARGLELAGPGPKTTQSFRDKVQTALEVLDARVGAWWGAADVLGLVRAADADSWRHLGQFRYYAVLSGGRPATVVDSNFTAGQTAERIANEARSGLFVASAGAHYRRHQSGIADAPRELTRWQEQQFTDATGHASVLAEIYVRAMASADLGGEAVVSVNEAAWSGLSWQQILLVLPMLFHVFKDRRDITVRVGERSRTIPMSLSRELAALPGPLRGAILNLARMATTLDEALTIIKQSLPLRRQSQPLAALAGVQADPTPRAADARGAARAGTGLVVREENAAPKPGRNPIAFTVAWKFKLRKPFPYDVVLIQRVSVSGNKTLSERGQTNYWEELGTIPAKQTESPNLDNWDYPGEAVEGPLPQNAHATLTMKGHVYAYELTPTLKEVLGKWRANQFYKFGATTWTAGTFPSNDAFTYRHGKDAHLVGEEAATKVLNVDFKTRTGNTIKISESNTW